jgi:hypothetical protein
MAHEVAKPARWSPRPGLTEADIAAAWLDWATRVRPTPAMRVGVSHVTLYVDDQDRALAF